MKKLAVIFLALAVSGAAYAGEPSAPSGFCLAIGWVVGKTEGLLAHRNPGGEARAETALIPGIPLYQLSSNRPSSSASVSEDRQASGTTSRGLAEFHLGRLSRSQRSARQVSGGIMTAFGIAGIISGAAMTSLDEEEVWFFASLGKVVGIAFILAGSALTVGGIYSLVAPSEAERDYRDAMRIEDPEQRERACRLALPELASHGRRNRIISGVITSVLSVVCLASSGGDEGSSSLAVGGLFGGMAVYSFLAKSPAEKALRNYEREAGETKTTQLAFGIGPHGRVQATLLVVY